MPKLLFQPCVPVAADRRLAAALRPAAKAVILDVVKPVVSSKIRAGLDVALPVDCRESAEAARDAVRDQRRDLRARHARGVSDFDALQLQPA